MGLSRKYRTNDRKQLTTDVGKSAKNFFYPKDHQFFVLRRDDFIDYFKLYINIHNIFFIFSNTVKGAISEDRNTDVAGLSNSNHHRGCFKLPFLSESEGLMK